jgi:hypothetical protein
MLHYACYGEMATDCLGAAVHQRFWHEKGISNFLEIPTGGADGNRNHDLFDANEALYQLSYSPKWVLSHMRVTTQDTLAHTLVMRNSRRCIGAKASENTGIIGRIDRKIVFGRGRG